MLVLEPFSSSIFSITWSLKWVGTAPWARLEPWGRENFLSWPWPLVSVWCQTQQCWRKRLWRMDVSIFHLSMSMSPSLLVQHIIVGQRSMTCNRCHIRSLMDDGKVRNSSRTSVLTIEKSGEYSNFEWMNSKYIYCCRFFSGHSCPVNLWRRQQPCCNLGSCRRCCSPSDHCCHRNLGRIHFLSNLSLPSGFFLILLKTKSL